MKKRLKKCISLVLAVILFIGTFPVYAMADEGAGETVRPSEPEELLCRFLCEETQAEVTVYAQDGTPVPVGEDGLHHLARGSYFYSAEAEGYASIDMCPFIVPADAEGDQELRISMTKLDEPAAEQAAKPEPGVGGAPSRTDSAIRVGLFAARFGMYQVFDVQRSPTYPGGTQKSPNPFKVRELSVPLDMDNLSEEDYFYFAGIGPASVTGIRCADGWNAAAQDLDPYTVALHFVKGKTDLELSRGVIGALSNKGFLYEAGGKCLWFSNEKGYYYASVGITYTPVEDGRLVCDENLLNTYKGQSMLKPAADAPRHTHVWSTEAEGNEAVFTCEAADCPYGEEHVFTMTLSVPAFVRLGASAEATLEKSEEDADWPEELEQNVITYIGRDGTDYPRSMKAPTGEGSYTAEVSVGYRKDARVLKADFAIVSGELKDFNKTLSADGVIVTVKAEAGVLPADAALSVTRADMDALKSTLAAVNGTREPAWLCGVAITLLDKDGNRIAPADGHSVSVSLALTEAADENLETRIFRMTTDETGALTAEEQNVNAFGGTGADAETDGSLLYVVELMRPVLHYGLTDTDTPLDELLAAVGLSGSAGNVSVSDSGVLGITGKDGARSLTILRSFTDLEWLRVTIRNVTYEISLTDETPSAACLRSGGHTWCEDNGHDPISCIVCGELQAIAEGLDFELEFDGDRWLHVGDGVTDIENYTLWDEMFRDMELSGDWAADLIRVTQTQLGYRESTANYTVSTHRERNGYTRYGAWYGIPYGEWCAMFLSFCLHYAGIEDDDMPYQSGCEAWIEALTERGMYTAEKGFRPQAGDLVFFDTDDDGKADHVALIREYNGNTGVLYTIEGNLDDEVGTREIGILDETILGYGLLPENKSSARRLQAVDVSDHPLVEVGASDDEPLLALDRLNPRTIALLGLSAARGRRLMAMRAAPGTQGSDDIPTEGPVDADGMTIEKVSVKWLSKSTGEDEPAGKGTLALSADTNTVGNQQFQLDFALSGKDDHEPGTVEIIFPAYLWKDRYGNEPGHLTLSVPEDPETGADFAWRRVGDNIIITNTRSISAASKVMIQGTFRDVKPADMVDKDVSPDSDYADAEFTGVSRDFNVTIGVTTPNDEYIALKSNTINATIDTHVEAASATKSAFNTTRREYYIYHKTADAAANNIPAEFLEKLGDDADEYSFVRWYVSGSATGSQPFHMQITDSFDDTIVHYLDPLHEQSEEIQVEGRLLGVQNALVWDEDTGAYKTGNVVCEDGQTVTATIYDGYNTLPKAAYVWSAYKKDSFPVEGDAYSISNTQTVEVAGWDDLITTTKEAEAKAPFRLPIVYKIKKVWNDEGHEDRRPDHQSFGVYYNEDLYTLHTVTARASTDEDKNWIYTWDDNGTGYQYKVREYGMTGTGSDITGRYHFMNVGNEEYSHIINPIYDDDGDLKEYDRWWYELEREEYDSEHHTWIKINTYHEEHVVRTLVPFEEQKLEVGIQKNRLNYGNYNRLSSSDRALNLLRRGDDVVVDYSVYGYGYIIELTKNVDLEGLKITDFGFRDVKLELEDNFGEDTTKDYKENTFLFDAALRLTPEDVEIAYVTIGTPTYLQYYQPDKYSHWIFRAMTAEDFDNYDRPDEELWGLTNGEWVRYAVMHVAGDGTVSVSCENGASLSGSNKVNLPKNVWKVKTSILIPGLKDAQDLDRRIDGARMNYNIGVRLLGSSETIRERLEALFAADDYAMCTLDNYAGINAYEQGGDLAISLDDQSRVWLHGRNHRSAVRQEKSFELVDNDVIRRELTLHSAVTMTQQSNILSETEYYEAREEGLIPSTESGTWYDLLPVGVMPVTSSVKLTGGDSITDVYTVENYKGSGRVLLVVKADVAPHVSYTSSRDPNPYHSDDTYPKEGYKDVHTLEFDAKYSWDEARLYGIGETVRNVAAYEADEDALGNINGWRGEPDDPTLNHNQRAMDAVGDDKDLMTDLDPARGKDHNAFVYSGAVLKTTEVDFQAATELKKYVTKDGLGSWTTGRMGQTQVNVYEGGYYTYMLYVASDSDTTTRNIILVDSLESYVPTEDKPDDYGRGRWQGNFVSVDVSPLEELGAAPVVYYYTGANSPDLSVLKADPENITANRVYDYIQGAGWSTECPQDPSTVRAIAVDLRHRQNGTEFEVPPDKNIYCTVRMRAKIYETAGQDGDPFNADEELRKDANNNDYAFNNIYLGCTQVDTVARETHAVISFDYVRVGILPFELKVTKVWDDANNNDGKRPNGIRVHLLANGQRLEPDQTVELNNFNNWTDKFEHVLQYDENGDWITYSFEEESTDEDETRDLTGYVQRVDRRGENVTITNTYEPEKTRLPFSKQWIGDEEPEARVFRPDSITVRLMADGVFTGKTLVVKPDRNGDWKGSFENLPAYTNPQGLSGTEHKIVYSVEEVPVYKYDVSYSPDPADDNYAPDPETGVSMTNKFWPYGTLLVSKVVEDVTEASKDKVFTFTLLLKDPDGEDLTEKFDYDKLETNDAGEDVVVESGQIGNGDAFTLRGGQWLKVKMLPSESSYAVAEDSTAGFTLVSASGSEGTIRAGSTQSAVFTNDYAAAGSQSFSLQKTLEGRQMSRYQFRFELVDKTPDSETFDQVIRTASADAAGYAEFSRVSYNGADHGKDFTYEIREVDRGKPGYKYDETTFIVKVHVEDNGDGTMTCTPTYYKADGVTQITAAEITFANEYHAEGDIVLHAWKQLPAGTLEAGQFTFELIRVDNDPSSATYRQGKVVQTIQNDAQGAVNFSAIQFTEKDVTDPSAGKYPFFYVIREVKGSDERVVYDESLKGVTLTVADNGNGTLAVTQTNVEAECSEFEGVAYYDAGPETTALPVFVNGLEPGDISVTKQTTWDDEDEPDPEALFPFRLDLVGNEDAGIKVPEKIRVELSAPGNNKHYEEGEVPAPSYADQIPGVEQVQADEGVQYFVAVDTDGGISFKLRAGQKLTVKDLPAGVAYQFQETIPPGWTLTFDNVAGVVVPKAEQSALYTNKYQPDVAVVTVVATKKLDGKTPAAQSFAFELVDDNEGANKGQVLETLWNHASGFVLFDLEYKTEGTYHYLIREVQKPVESVTVDDDGNATIVYSEDETLLRTIEFDERVMPVTVTVVKSEDPVTHIQNMTATVSYGEPTISDDGTQVPARPPQFENKTRPGSLQIMKAATGLTSANKDAVFTFKVRLSNDAGMPLTESGQMFWYAKPVEKADESPVTENTEPPAEPEDSVPDPEPSAPSPAPGMRTRNAVLRSVLMAQAKTQAISQQPLKASGTVVDSGNLSSSVKWVFYSDGTLSIEPVDGVSGSFNGYPYSWPNRTTEANVVVTKWWPWYKYNDRIKYVVTSGRIEAHGVLGCMFRQYHSILRADLSHIDSTNVTNIDYLFGNAYNLKELNLHGWTTPASTQAVLWGCRSLKVLDIGRINSSLDYNNGTGYNLEVIILEARSNISQFPLPSGTWVRMSDNMSLTNTQLRNQSGSGLPGVWVKSGSTYSSDYVIAFEPNGATGTMDSITVSIFDSFTLPKCTFESDLNFAGWATNPDAILPEYEDEAVFNGGAMGGQTITLYAVWIGENSFLINYDANGGYTATQWQRVNDPEGSVTMPVPTHPSGYEFLYWTTDPEGDGERFNGTVPGTSFHAQPGDTVKLYAQYLDPSKRGQVTVEHYQQNPDGSDYALYEKDLLGAFQIDEKVTPVKKTYVGFVPPTEFQVFAGASTTGTTQDDGTEITVVRGGVVVRYYYDRTHYNLAFDANGGEGEMDEVEMTGGVPAKLPVNRFTKDNSVFVGWNTQPDGTGVNYGDGQSVNSIADSGTVTLYAQWFSLDDGQSAEPTNGEYTVTCKANEVIVFPTLPAGTHYEVVEVDLPEGWSLTGIDNGSGTVLSAERVNVKATNAYSAYGTADLLARKSLPGESFNPGDFSFELVDESGTVLQTVANSRVDENEQISGEDEETIPNPNYGTAPVYFDTIRYEQPGDYRYTIREKVGNNMAIRYDTHEEQVIVHVTDRGDGRLVTQVIYDASGASFRNGMSTGDLTVSKTITNATEAAAEKSFSFTLYLFDSAGVEIGESYPYTVSDGRTGQIRSGGVITMKGGESFSVTGLPHKSSYIVTETPADGFELVATEKPEGTVIAGETVQASFENAYTSRTDEADGGAVIEARKAYEHGVLEDDLFQFRLLDENEEEVDTAYAKADGSITFAPLHYTLADDGKKYLYYIEEVPGDDPNVIYDDHRERVLVSVSDNGDGTMTAEVEYPGRTGDTATLPPLFTNKREDGSLVISKELLEYEGSEPATFVFRVEGELDGKKVISTVKTLTFTGKGSDSVTVEKIPVGTVVTVTEEYTGARFKLDSAAAQEAQIPAPEDGPAAVSFSNRYDNTVDGGHGILNTFGAKPNPDFDPLDPDSPRYIWDGWTKTP